MCGLFAFVLKRPAAEPDLRRARAAALAMAHRGPDGSGEWLSEDRTVFLAHRRLSIIDLSDQAAQPMRRGNLVIAFNGEIYNYRSLRSRLESLGERFHTTSDTEVLLAAWHRWGRQSLDHVDGMFAFVLWDGTELHAVTDPFGEKPLYVGETAEGVYFSSEVGPLAAALDAEKITDPTRLTAFMSLGCLPAPLTFFRGIERSDAATILTIRGGAIRARSRYWTAPIGTPGRGRVQPLTESDLASIEQVIARRLEDRLHADVPVCIFLSSGVDSSLVSAIARHQLGARPATLTVSFPRGRAVDEADDARRIAQALDLPHEVITSDRASASSAEELLSIFGQPHDNVSALAVRQISRAARTRFKVALSGLGGDELFFGYRKHTKVFRLRALLRTPEGFRRLIGSLANRGRSLWPRLGLAADLIGIRDSEVYLAHKTYGIFGWLRELPAWDRWTSEHFGSADDPVELVAPAYDLRRTMNDNLLPAQDLGSMRESFELRCPFLTRDLAELMATFDPRALLAFGRKSVLYRLLSRHLSDDVILKRKAGFVFPMDEFLAANSVSQMIVPALSPALASEAWQRRGEADGWNHVAARLLLLHRFFGDHQSIGSVRAPVVSVS
ncbi:MAG: asparagine synthase (glutamine-hydrolyzing) [Alphaproteobacteria bacterium]|nr:asparagine synthase (glutamine-hydrolyzing) [Alphaproteobacteria bacterium]